MTLGVLNTIFIFYPGGCSIDGEDDAYDFGSGAGFYLDATEDKWKTNYRMYSYITKEVNRLQMYSYITKEVHRLQMYL